MYYLYIFIIYILKVLRIDGLRSVLHNDSYTGIYRYSDIVIEGGMPVIISKDLYNQVQGMFAKNKSKGSQRANGLDEKNAPRYWLTGKLFCGECGQSMQGVSGTSKTKTKYYYYYCSAQRKKRCEKRPVRKDDIENLVIEILSDFLNDSENLELRAWLHQLKLGENNTILVMVLFFIGIIYICKSIHTNFKNLLH